MRIRLSLLDALVRRMGAFSFRKPSAQEYLTDVITLLSSPHDHVTTVTVQK